MKTVDLEKLIEAARRQFAQSRPGDLQPVLVTIPPDLPKVYSEDDFLERLLAEVFRTTLRSAASGKPPIRIAVRQRKSLPDLEVIIGVSPVYWIQIEISGRDVWSLETLWSLETVLQNKSEIFGYHCQERKSLKDGAPRLALFCASGESTPTMAVYVSKDGFHWKCDFLIPVLETHAPDAA